MNQIVTQSQCTGCGACVASCPRSCIVMREDAVGFFYPKIDPTRCIQCGICRTVCPELTPLVNDNSASPSCSVAWALDKRIRFESASGGAFAQFAEQALGLGWIIYGAAFDSDFNLSYRAAATIEELARLKSSKYCHSAIGGGLAEIAKNLQMGRSILFGGTACQIAGLFSYLKHRRISTDHLLTCGLICHGVAPKRLLKDFIHFSEAKWGKRISRINLRSKPREGQENSPFSPLTCALYSEDGEEKLLELKDNPYMLGFIKGMNYRENCYACPYARLPRVEDITLGDYFEADPDVIDDIRKGVSIILLNSQKAQRFFEGVEKEFHCTPVPLEQVVARKRNLTHPTSPHKWRSAFMEDYARHGFAFVEQKYLRYRPLRECMERMQGRIRGVLSKIKRKVIG